METKKYLDLAKAIQNNVEQIFTEYKSFKPTLDDMIFYNPSLYEEAIKFTHLVYAFDPNLPLNKEMVDLPKTCKGGILPALDHEGKVFKDFLFLIGFFVEYLETFHS